MGRLRGRAAALAAAALLCLSLTACGETKMTVFDATAYVKGVLDETYKGTWNNAFLDLVELTAGTPAPGTPRRRPGPPRR